MIKSNIKERLVISGKAAQVIYDRFSKYLDLEDNTKIIEKDLIIEKSGWSVFLTAFVDNFGVILERDDMNFHDGKLEIEWMIFGNSFMPDYLFLYYPGEVCIDYVRYIDGWCVETNIPEYLNEILESIYVHTLLPTNQLIITSREILIQQIKDKLESDVYKPEFIEY